MKVACTVREGAVGKGPSGDTARRYPWQVYGKNGTSLAAYFIDLIPMSPDGKQGQWVKDFEANQWMLWWDNTGNVTWYWGLAPLDESQTRLITRVRMRYHWLSPMLAFELLVEFADIVMMRKCLLGIKQRAESMSRQASEPVEVGTPQ